ncbi:MAG: hypothetical protein JO323_04125, partial [Acidobacteriia bacterium]|nr:hypothetical protein [Terriglobia bacterium]
AVFLGRTEVPFVLVSAVNQSLVLKLATPLQLGQEVTVRYSKKAARVGPVAVLPTSGDVDCCDFQPVEGPVTVRGRVPTAAPLEVIVTRKNGMAERTRIARVETDGEFTIPLRSPLDPGDSVKVTTGTGPDRAVLASATFLAAGRPASAAAEPSSNPIQATATAGPCADPYLPHPPAQVDSVPVVLGCLPNNSATDLTFYIDNRRQDVIWSLAGTTPITYSAKLPEKLKPDQSVKVHQVNQRDPDSPSQNVVGIIAPPATVLAVQEGASSVSGFGPGLDKVRIQVVDGADVQAQVDTSVDSETNQFSATLSTPLQADQQLNIYGISRGVISETPKQVEVAPLELDWGRVRAYFTAGIVLSNSSAFNTTDANTFLGLTIDKGWVRPVYQIAHGPRFWDNLRVHTFFDARLTAIPTTVVSSVSTLISTQLSNSQAGSLQIGGYLPIVITNWTYKDRPYSLYVAPLAKTGFYTLTSSGSTSYQTQLAVTGNDRFFTFYAYGVRVGHYREYQTPDGRFTASRAPEQLSYLDLTVGRWSNFEAFGGSATYRPWRYGFEGILKIPNTPLILGLNANVNAERIKSPLFQLPPDDLRFLFGVRFDASKLTNLLGSLTQ